MLQAAGSVAKVDAEDIEDAASNQDQPGQRTKVLSAAVSVGLLLDNRNKEVVKGNSGG